MKKLFITLAIAAPLALLSGCTATTVGYNDAYVSDNVYTAGYNTSPYWGSTYYTGYGWNPGVTTIGFGNGWGGGWGGGWYGGHGRWGHGGWGHHGGGHRR